MTDIKWVKNHLEVKPTKKPKKITGTRFATILGLNPWSTQFEIWCAITRTYEKPFEDTVYTKAGKIIEPKQAEYMRESYMMDNLVTPTDVFGEDYFHKTWGDFFPESKHLGGMWDYLLYEDGKPTTVLEMKTTKRSEDWAEDVPEYYALQAALYAYLLDVDDVIMVCSFLEPNDYAHPEKFTPNINNTITVEFSLSERYPNFANKVEYVENWWSTFVETGISPDYDEKRDLEILDALSSVSVTPDKNLSEIIAEAAKIKATLDEVKSQYKESEKRLKTLESEIKSRSREMLTDNVDKVTLSGAGYTWTYSKTVKAIETFDTDLMAKDGVLNKYRNVENTESYRLTSKKD